MPNFPRHLSRPDIGADKNPIMRYFYSRVGTRRGPRKFPTIGPRFTDDRGEMATDPPPIRATLFLDHKRE